MPFLAVSLPILLAFTGSFSASFAAGESRTSKEAGLVLDNGLRLLLDRRPGSPVIALTAIVAAGSDLETPEQSGASHFLEHLLFNGTASRTQEELYAEVDRLGLYNNASTREEFTLFQMVGAAETLEKALEIQSDMLFNSTLPAAKFQKEKGIVLEEMASDMSRPIYGESLQVKRLLFPGTARSRPVLGTADSIGSMDRADVLRYYKSRYRPANTVLVVAGGFELDEVLQAVKRTFGKAPAGTGGGYPDREAATGDRLGAPADRSGTPMDLTTATQGTTRRGTVAWRLPDLDPAGRTAWKLLANLASGPASGELELGFETRSGPGGSWLVVASPMEAGQTLPDLRAVAVAGLREVVGSPRFPDRFEQSRTSMLAEDLRLREQLHYDSFYRADDLAAWRGGDQPVLEAGRLIELSPGTLGALVDALDASSDLRGILFQPESSQASSAPPLAGSSKTPAAGSSSARPSGDDAVVTRRDAPVRTLFESGLRLVTLRDPSTRVLAVHVLIDGRNLAEAPGQAGVAELLHRMLKAGTKYRDRRQLEGDLGAVGASLKVADDRRIPFDDYYFSPLFSYVRLEALADRWQGALSLLADMIWNPGLELADFKREKRGLLRDLRADNRAASRRARSLLMKSLLGAGPWSHSPLGVEQDLQSLDLEALRRFQGRYFEPSRIVISIVSPIPGDALERQLRQLVADRDREPSRPSPAQSPGQGLPEGDSGPLHLEAPPAGPPSAQLQLRMARRLDRSPDRRPTRIVLASLLSERLADRVREKLGLAYSIGAAITEDVLGARISIRLGTRPGNLKAAREAVSKVLDELCASPPAEEEVERTLGRLRGRMAMRAQTSIGRAYRLGLAEWQGYLAADDMGMWPRLAQVNGAAVQEEANRVLDGSDWIEVTAR